MVCLALAAPVMADDFYITSGTTTNDGNTINTGDTVTVTGALTTTGSQRGIETSGGTNTVIVSETGNITAGGDGINADDEEYSNNQWECDFCNLGWRGPKGKQYNYSRILRQLYYCQNWRNNRKDLICDGVPEDGGTNNIFRSIL